jgi:hypothetical protein
MENFLKVMTIVFRVRTCNIRSSGVIGYFVDANDQTQFFDPTSNSRTTSLAAGAQHKPKHGGSMYASTYGATAATMNSAMFYSAFDVNHADDDFSYPEGHRHSSDLVTRHHTKLHLRSINLQFSDVVLIDKPGEGPTDGVRARLMEVYLSECIFDMKTVNLCIVEEGVVKITVPTTLESIVCSVMSLGIREYIDSASHEVRRSSRCLLAFDSELRQSEISVGPAVEIDVSGPTASRGAMLADNRLDVNIRMRSVLASLHTDSVTFWTDVFSSLSIPAAGEASSVEISFSVVCPSLHLIVHSDLSHSKQKWRELNLALDLSNATPSAGVLLTSPWEDVLDTSRSSGPNTLNDIFRQSPGGLWATFQDIKVTNNLEGMNKPVASSDSYCKLFTMDKLLFKLFLWDMGMSHVQETLILEAFKSKSTRDGISVESTVIADVPRNDGPDSESFKDSGLPPPNLDRGFVVYIKADTIAVDIAQREYNALISISGFLAPSKIMVPEADLMLPRQFVYSRKIRQSTGENLGPHTSVPGFGVVLSANTCTIRVSSSDDFSCSQGFHRHATSEVPLEELLQQTFASKYNGPAEFIPALGSDLSNPFVFSVAGKGVVLEMFAVDAQTYFTASALDLSVFESELSDLRSSSASLNPFLHRSSLIHNISSHEGTETTEVLNGGVSPREGWVLVDDSHDDFGSDGGHVGRDSVSAHTVYVDPRALSHLLRRQSHVQHVYGVDLLPSTAVSNNFNRLHTVSLQVMTTEVPSVVPTFESNQEIQFHMDFINVTHHLDPKSNWINAIASLMTPIRPETVLDRRHRIKAEALKLQSLTQSVYQSRLGNFEHVVSVEEETVQSKPAAFSVTKVSICVSNCLIDYKCREHDSRMLLSIGTLAIFTTIVSSSNLFTVKVTADNIDTYVSKYLNSRRELEQNPLGVDGTFKPVEVSDRDRLRLQSEFDVESVFEHNVGSFDGMRTASEFLDLHHFVPLLALSKTSLLVTINAQFGSATRDNFILRNRGTLLVVGPGSGVDNALNEVVVDNSGNVDVDADDEIISGFSATAVVMSMHGCHFEARMDTVDVLVVSALFYCFHG